MTTKEFIKMLQDVDPTGESHVRIPGGVPIAVARIPGYYDGNYAYIDKNDNYVSTMKGDKVDIYCKDSSDIIEENYDEAKTKEENWEVIKSKFIFDLGSGITDREKRFMKRVYKKFEEHHKFEENYKK